MNCLWIILLLCCCGNSNGNCCECDRRDKNCGNRRDERCDDRRRDDDMDCGCDTGRGGRIGRVLPVSSIGDCDEPLRRLVEEEERCERRGRGSTCGCEAEN